MVQGVPQKIDRTKYPDTSDIVSSTILIKNKQPNHSIKGIPFDGMKLFVDLRVNKEKNLFTILLLLTKTDEPSLTTLPLRKDKEFASSNLHTC